MFDCYNRKINYLRISVTDRCNSRCVYCMPEEGIPLIPHDKVLRFEEIIAFTKVAVSYGIDKVRLTGGEPLVRKNIEYLVAELAKISEIKDLSMTTNGFLLAKYATLLKESGLQRINISLDTLNPDTFRKITRIGNLPDVLNGIEAAQKAGLQPIKINCVIQNNPNEPDALAVAEFCKQHHFQVRFIRQMNLQHGEFWPVYGGKGGNCHSCNRLRLTSDGFLLPCLFSDKSYHIKELGYAKAIETAIAQKPKSGSQNHNLGFYNIGG